MEQAEKIPVMRLHKREQRVFVSVVKNCSQQELMPIRKGFILEKNDVYTDGWKVYDGVRREFFPIHLKTGQSEMTFTKQKSSGVSTTGIITATN